MPDSGDPFVGRRDELAQLGAALADTLAGKSRLVLLSGEPGIGKTRTAQALAAEAEEAGTLVLWGRCHEEAGAPSYWPWAQALRTLAGALGEDALREDLGAGAPDIAEVIPELRARIPGIGLVATPSDPAAARFRLFASMAAFLLAASRRRPLVTVLDDLHWADAPSLRFLRFLVPELGTARLMLIATYRENALSRQHPLSDALGDVVRSAGVMRLRLTGLAAEESGALMAGMAGTAPPPSLARALHAQTEGNPLFLREIVRFLGQRGLLDPARGMAVPASLRIPEGVREVIGQRLNLLSPACNQVLRVASVIGREFDVALLHRVWKDGSDAVTAALDEALDARIVEDVRPDRYQFTHALIRMTLQDELRAGERQRLHRAVGEALEGLNRHDPDAVLPELARHFREAGGDTAKAIDYAQRAGQQAEAVLAFEEATSLFQAALDLMLQQNEPDARAHAALLVRVGDAQRKANDYDAARTSLRTAVELARRHRLPDLLADAAVSFEVSTFRRGYIGQRNRSLLQEALAALPASETARRVRVLTALARAQFYSGDVAAGRVTAREAAALARSLGDDGITARSLLVQLEIPAEPHETVAMLALGHDVAAMAERGGEMEIAAQTHLLCAGLALELGRMEACRAAIASLHRVGRQVRQLVFTLFEIGFRAALALHRGDLDEAETLIREGIRLDRTTRSDAGDPLALLVFALRREQDRLSEVAPLVEAIARDDAAAVWRPGLALLFVDLGRHDAARRLFEGLAADGFVGLARDGRWISSMAFLAEVCVALGDASRAAILYGLLLPYAGRNLVPGNGAGSVGAADRQLGLLAATMGNWPDAERHFAAALALNEATGGLAPLAHTRHDLAAMLLGRGGPGDAARARALLDQTLAEATRLGLAALARRVRERLAEVAPPPPDPDALTPREAEVLDLIAMGRTNADIALVLAIGVNTVATHVRSILAKTGCANRTEAAAYALRQPGNGRAPPPPA
ncbi:helix-turn-helix transcriptional regulator [Elioraea rosea]|uniref:helix-turn-helix transcriptional regulator n=1 Tax=Elioraea rosea TaxID=2492390 RepID=UPI0011844795|nr:AAA family ATPase [Elioraea rosea]